MVGTPWLVVISIIIITNIIIVTTISISIPKAEEYAGVIIQQCSQLMNMRPNSSSTSGILTEECVSFFPW